MLKLFKWGKGKAFNQGKRTGTHPCPKAFLNQYGKNALVISGRLLKLKPDTPNWVPGNEQYFSTSPRFAKEILGL